MKSKLKIVLDLLVCLTLLTHLAFSSIPVSSNPITTGHPFANILRLIKTSLLSDKMLTVRLHQETEGPLTIAYHAGTGRVRFIGTSPQAPMAPPTGLAANATGEQAARAFLSAYAPLFGLTDPAQELILMSSREQDQGRTFARFQQIYQSIPVLGGELIAQTNAKHGIISVNGEILPDLTLNTTPSIDAETARQTAIAQVAKDYGLDVQELNASEPELWIYNPILLGGPGPRISSLVWRTEVQATERLSIRELVLVEAHLGFVVLHFNQTDSVKNRIVYDHNNTVGLNLPGTTPVCTEGNCPNSGNDYNNAYNYAGDVYDFYSSYHGRDSIDNSGMQIISTVRYCDDSDNCPYANAFWNGEQMVYGDGYASADDVVAHEMTHGVTDYESKLHYYYQSGAINEAFSDIWGEFVDLTNGAGNDSPNVRWLMGEDLSIGAIRSMSDPTLYDDPDKMTSPNYNCDFQERDKGGVHGNSGVGNKAAYLMVDGGAFNGKVITGLGITKTAKIFYEVQVNFLTTAGDYQDLYNGLQQACANLIGADGITAADCQEVKKAVDATEMHLQPAHCGAPEAPICPSGDPDALFFDDLENPSSGNWSHAATSGVDEWYYPQTANPYDLDIMYASSGQYHLWGLNTDSVADYHIQMNSDVALPAGNTAYLRFNHAYGFEDSDTGTSFYDGGIIEYSTNGGSTWSDAKSLIIDNGYNGSLASNGNNPLGGRQAFAGESNGYISTRLDLNSLAGQSVRFRFRIGTDPSEWDWGWFIDDIHIYTCDTGPNTPPTLSNLSDQTVPRNSGADNAIDLWPFANDAESAVGDLTFTIDNSPDANAGISIDSNRYVDINPTAGWTGQTDVTIRVTDPGGQSGTDTFQVTVIAMALWNGNVSHDWHDANNWTPVGVPAIDANVTIPDVARDPVIATSDAAVSNLTVARGAVLDLTQRTLTVEGDLINNGTLKQTLSVMAGTTGDFIHITNQAGTQTKYYGVDITPTSNQNLNTATPTGASSSPDVADKNLILGNHPVPADNDIPLSETAPNLRPMAIVNGDFESGSSGWDEYSVSGWTQIVTVFPVGVTPHSGSWAAWLGGAYNERASIAQNTLVAASSSTLSFWYWIASADVCGYDVAGVLIGDETVVDVFELCEAHNTGGWVERTVDLSAYAGQTVKIQFRVVTDSSGNSNFFVDDVAFVSLTAPDIAVSPASLEITATQESSATGLLTISNTGTAALSFEIQEQPGVSWLSVDPSTGALTPGSSAPVQALFNAAALAPGNYNTSLLVNSNDPDENPITIQVLFHVLTGTINTAPTLANLSDQVLRMNDNANNAIDLWAYAADAESSDAGLTFTLDNAPDSNAGVSIDSNRYIDILPATGWNGQTTVTIRVTDPGDLYVLDSFQVIVTDTESTPPTIAGLPNQEVLVNEIKNNVIDLWAYAADAESPDDALTFSIDNLPDPSAGVSIDSNRYIDISPATDWMGETDIVIRVNDPVGLSGRDTFHATITDTPNTPPTMTGLPDQIVRMDNSANNVIDLWAYTEDTGTADANLIFAIDNAPNLNAGISIDGNQYVDIVPTTGWTGQTSVTIRVTDTSGLSATDTFTVEVADIEATDVTVSVSGNQFCAGRASGIKRCFDIQPAGALNANVRFYFSESERNQENPAALLVWRYVNGWAEESGPYTCGGTGDKQYVQAQSIHSFSLFALGSANSSNAIYLPLVTRGH